jgi:hypothetical protein
MRKFRKLAAGVAALTVAGVGFPAGAQTDEVPVSLENTSGSRTILIEDMTGNELQELAFGASRSLPFRVRVQDQAIAATPFTVNASLTNLYFDETGVDYSTLIESENVKLEPQVGLGFDVLDLEATVQPIVDLVATLTGPLAPICATLTGAISLPTGGCTVEATGVVADVLDLTIPVDLSNLTNLPLLPQNPDTGFFTEAEYGGGVGLGDPAGANGTGGRLAGTQWKLAAGSPVTSNLVFDPLTDAVNDLTRSEIISDAAVLAAFNEVVTKLASPLINTLGATTTDLLNATAATAQTLGADELLALTGQYISLPKLSVTVPVKDPALPAGTYRGTLVVTGLQ